MAADLLEQGLLGVLHFLIVTWIVIIYVIYSLKNLNYQHLHRIFLVLFSTLYFLLYSFVYLYLIKGFGVGQNNEVILTLSIIFKQKVSILKYP